MKHYSALNIKVSFFSFWIQALDTSELVKCSIYDICMGNSQMQGTRDPCLIMVVTFYCFFITVGNKTGLQLPFQDRTLNVVEQILFKAWQLTKVTLFANSPLHNKSQNQIF